MGYLSREELEDAIKAGGSVLIGRRVVSRLEDLPDQETIDEAHAAKREYVTGLPEQVQQPPQRVPSATALPEGPPPNSAPPVPNDTPPENTLVPEGEPLADASDDSPAGKAKR